MLIFITAMPWFMTVLLLISVDIDRHFSPFTLIVPPPLLALHASLYQGCVHQKTIVPPRPMRRILPLPRTSFSPHPGNENWPVMPAAFSPYVTAVSNDTRSLWTDI